MSRDFQPGPDTSRDLQPGPDTSRDLQPGPDTSRDFQPGRGMGREVRRVVPRAALQRVVAVGLLAAIGVLGVAAPAHADKVRSDQWHLSFLDISRAHQISQGEGVTVAVLDTGVDSGHADLKNNVLPGADVVAGGSGNGWGDVDGHGSGMAGLVAAHGHGAGNADGALGIAPKAKVLPIRIGTTLGLGSGSAMGLAVDEAVKRGAKIITMSIGTDASSFDAIQKAIKAGVIVIAAAGNRPKEAFIGDPGRYPGVVAVGAVGRDGNVADVSVRDKPLALLAPGVDIVSTGKNGTYRIGTGTSPSSAIVAGAAALVWSKYPQLSSTQVVDHLTRTATDKGTPGRDDEYGFGVLDVMKALNTIPSASSPTAAAPTGNNLPPLSSGQAATPNGDGSGTSAFLVVGIAVLAAIVALIAFAIHKRSTAGR